MWLPSSKQILLGFVLCAVMPTLAAHAADTQPRTVLVEDNGASSGGMRLNYPLLISAGRGYRIRCSQQSDEEDVIRGLGFTSVPSTVLDPLSPIVTGAAPQENPVLCPRSESYVIRAFRHDGRFYLQFPEESNPAAYTNKLYIPGCKGLFDALKIDPSIAVDADPTPFYPNATFEIECKAGEPIQSSPGTFAAWCARPDLSPAQAATVVAMLKATPEGEAAFGNPSACRRAETSLEALHSLDLSDQQITDVAPLAPLSKLTFLNLSGNRLADISGLAQLTGLGILDLSRNEIANLSPLSPLPVLTELNLAGNKISNLRPLSSLSLLQKLDLSRNQIRDLGPLSHLLPLTQLKLANNALTGAAIEPITGLSALVLLDLSNNQVEMLDYVGEFPSTVSVKLDGNPVVRNQITTFGDTCLLHEQDATPFGFTIRAMLKATGKQTCREAAAVLSSLAELALNGQGISDVRPLALLANLRNLDLSYNSIVDVSSLKSLTDLRKLNLIANSIRDISPIGQLLNLETLDLTGNPVDVSSYLPACLMRNADNALNADQRAEVTALFEAAKKPTCLESQEYLQHVTNLRVAGAELTTLGYFSLLQKVESLELQNNKLTDVAGLADLNALVRLDLKENKLSNLESLHRISKLTALSVANNPIRSLEGVASMPFIEDIDISNTSVTYIRPLALLPRLQHAEIRNLSITYRGFMEYCLVRKFAPDALAERRPLIDAVVEIAKSYGVNVDNCSDVEGWATRVESLNLNRRNIRDLTPIRLFHALKELFLARNQIEDIGPLHELFRLERLSLAGNIIEAIPGSLTDGGLNYRLKWLDLSNNRIAFVGRGWNIPETIRTLNLSGNRIENVKLLDNMSRLTVLDVRNNKIDDARAVLKYKPYLGGNPICVTTKDPETIAACGRAPTDQLELQ